MPRKVKIWRVWDSYDMALSDTFHPTRKEALAHLKSTYNVTPSMLKKDGEYEWLRADLAADEHSNVSEVYLAEAEILMTRAGVCHALTHMPHR